MIAAAVVDASVAIKWVVQEEHSDQARLLSIAKLEAPDLMLVECANILWKKVLLGDLRASDVTPRLALLLRSPVVLTASRELLESALRISLDLKHPVYDCVYLALALKRNIPLVTADRKLFNAARKRRRPGAKVELLAQPGE